MSKTMNVIDELIWQYMTENQKLEWLRNEIIKLQDSKSVVEKI